MSELSKIQKAWQQHYEVKQKILQAKAYSITHRAIEDGILHKCPCVICGALQVDAHHEDYSYPLNVIWLCRSCHTTYHNAYIQSHRDIQR